jgi:methionyl-tRNA synthetase
VHYEAFAFHFVMNEIFEAIYQANRYLDDTKPWTLAKNGKQAEVAGSLRNAAEALRIIAILAQPVIPTTCAKIWEQLGLGPIGAARLEEARSWPGIKPGTRVAKAAALFPRLEGVPNAEEFA